MTPVSNYQASLALNEVVDVNGIFPTHGGAGGAFIGEIFTYAFSHPTVGMQANGSLLPISSNQALYAILGATFGGDGYQNFGLPNLTDTVIVGTGARAGLPAVAIGQTEGTASTTLTTSQLPAIDRGASQAFTDYQPSLAITYMIRTQGIFPTRGDGSGQDGDSGQDFLGEVVPFAGNYAPSDYMIADGRVLAIQQYAALFAILGTTYGGDGRTTFALPDLRGRAIIGADSSSGLSLGATVGQSTVQLTNASVPIGGSAAFDNREPALALNYIIALNGIYPSAGGTPDTDDAFVGQIKAFAGTFVPAGYALANGQILNISGNEELFSLIGTTYGGNGTSTFALPDLRNRVVTDMSVSHALGSTFGSNTTSITAANLPPIAAPIVAIALASDTGTSSTDGKTNNATLTGTGIAGALVSFTIDGVQGGSTTANGSGVWSYTPALVNGVHTISARQVNDGGTGSASLTFTLDTVAPVLSSQGTVTVYAARATGAAATFAVTANDAVDGTADVVTTKEGATAVHSGDTFAVGTHTITASTMDVAGNGAATSFSVVVKYEPVSVATFLATRATLDAGDPFVIVDSAANIVASLDALASDAKIIGLTLTDSGTPTLKITATQFTTDSAFLKKITNASYLVTATTSDGTALVQSGSPVGSSVFSTDAAGHTTDQKIYVGSLLTEEYFFDTSRRVTEDRTFDNAGNIASRQIYYAGTSTLQEFVLNGITGTSYDALDYTYALDGTPIHQILYAGAHVKIYDYTFDPATGAKSTAFFDSVSGAPTRTFTTNANGTTDTRLYNATGGGSSDFFYDAGNHLTKRDIYDTLTHKSETLAYDNAGVETSDTSYDAAGNAFYVATFYPGTTNVRHVDQTGITGASYHGLHLDYDAGNVLAYEGLDLNGGGYATVAFGNNRTLTTTTGADDSLQAAGTNETFVFHANMGHDVLTSFVAAGTGHDVLTFDTSMFAPGTANANSLLNSFGSDVAATTGLNAQPASVLLTFDANNSVLVRNATVATLHANTGDFAFA